MLLHNNILSKRPPMPVMEQHHQAKSRRVTKASSRNEGTENLIPGLREAQKSSETTTFKSASGCFWQTQKQDRDNSLHSKVKENDLQGLVDVLRNADEEFDIDAVDFQGRSALHLAAQHGNIRMIQELLGASADMWKNDSQGLPPALVAAKHGYDGAARVLAAAMKEKNHNEEPWYPTRKIEQMIEKSFSKGQVSELKLDKFVANLVGIEVEELNDRSDLYTYCSHLHSWVGSILNFPDEGWWVSHMLPQRLRTLINLLATPHAIPKGGIGGMKHHEVRKKIADEISGQLETLRADRRFASLRGLHKKESKQLMIGIEANQISWRVHHLRQDEELTLKLGFPGHALYVNFSRGIVQGTAVVNLRLDNLGAGYLKTHGNDDAGRVYPISINIPLGKNKKVINDFQKMMRFLISHQVGLEGKDWDTFYAHVAEFHDQLAKKHGREFTDEAPNTIDTSTKRAQTAGNCVLKNHSAGMIARLGRPLFKWVKEQEIKFVRSRADIISDKLYREKELEKSSSVLLELLEDTESNYSDLIRMLSKASHHDVGTQVPAEVLAELVEDDQEVILRLLFSKGANYLARDYAGNTLLHCAAATNATQAIEAILANQAKINSQNNLGQSPLHLAVQNGNVVIFNKLLAAGADRTLLDNNGLSAKDLLESRIHDDQQMEDAFFSEN